MMPERARRLGRAAVVAVALMLPLASGAVIPKGPVRKPVPMSGDQIVEAARQRAQVADCRGALAMLDPLVASSPPTPGGPRFSAQLLRMPCLAAVGRGAEVPPVLAELKAEAPDHPLVLGFEIFADVDAGKFGDAADGMASLADKRSRALDLIPGKLWRAIYQKLTVAHDIDRRDRAVLALAQVQWQPNDMPEVSEGLTADAIGILLGRNDADTARSLLPRIVRPGLLWGMAIQRRYALLWPDIEARMGPASGLAADRYARRALAAYAADPADDTSTRDAVRAFISLGRLDDAGSTAAPVKVAPGMSDAQIEIVLTHAQALAIGGDQAAALAILAPFTTLDLLHTPEAAGALIQNAEMQDETGHYDQELAQAHAALATKGGFYSPLGLAWLKRDEVCALSGLHRAAEAKVAGDALKANAKDNEAAAIEGLLCAGRDDEAAQIAIATLASTEGTDRLADQFQPGEAIYARPSMRLRAQWTRLLQRPDVKAAFDKSARILPKSLWPSPEPRAVPLLPGSANAGPTT